MQLAFLLFSLISCNEEFSPKLTEDFPNLIGLERIKAWMDESVDPCDDFYMHACGGFMERYKDFKNPKGDKSNNIVSLMGQTSSLLMKMILNGTHDPSAKTSVERDIFFKTKDYYNSCIREDIIEVRGFKPILSVAKKITEKWNGNENPIKIVAELQAAFGVKLFFQSKYTSVPTKNIDDLRLQLVPAQPYRIKKSTILKVLEMYSNEELLGDDFDLEQIASIIYRLERRQLMFSKHLNALHAPETLDLEIDIPLLSAQTGLDWQSYVKSLKLPRVEKIHLWEDRKYWIKNIRYFLSQPRQDLMFYSLWRLAVNHFNKLSNPFYSLWKKEIFKRKLKLGVYNVDSAYDGLRVDCIRETGTNLKYLAGYLYVKYAFNATQKANATLMVDNLFNSLRKRFTEVKWMDDSTRKSALKKLDNLVKIVGYPSCFI